MALGASSTVADAELTQADDYTWVQLHVGDPGSAGTANVAANSTRKQVAWNAPSAGATGFRKIDTSATITWTAVSTTETYTYYTLWSASSAGTFGHSGTVSGGAVTSGNNFDIAAGALVVSTPIAG
jgi:hypothetical protein